MLTYYEGILEFRIFDYMDHVISLFCEILSLTLLRCMQRGRSRYMNCENYVLFLAIIMTLHAIQLTIIKIKVLMNILHIIFQKLKSKDNEKE